MKSSLFVVIVGMFYLSLPVFSHCQVPCGIYDDAARIKLIKEHITTIEKSMNEIIELSKGKEKNYNQLVRWINNKEEHADKVQHIISEYFMTQRIKVVEGPLTDAKAKYQKEIMLLHQMLVYAMKAKQTTDLSYIKKLKTTIEEFEKLYLKK